MTSGNVSSLIGSGSNAVLDGVGLAASLSAPTAMAFSADGTFVLMMDKDIVRMVIVSSLHVTSLAGGANVATTPPQWRDG